MENNMKLYIQIKNGVPFEHPISEANFKQAFPNVDVNNLPSDFAEFERVEIPLIGPYEVYEGVTYERDGDVIKDVHHVRQLTLEEKTTKQNAVKDYWAENGYASWIFNEATCAFDPPVPRPSYDNYYNWDEETTSWLEVTP